MKTTQHGAMTEVDYTDEEMASLLTRLVRDGLSEETYTDKDGIVRYMSRAIGIYLENPEEKLDQLQVQIILSRVVLWAKILGNYDDVPKEMGQKESEVLANILGMMTDDDGIPF